MLLVRLMVVIFFFIVVFILLILLFDGLLAHRLLNDGLSIEGCTVEDAGALLLCGSWHGIHWFDGTLLHV